MSCIHDTGSNPSTLPNTRKASAGEQCIIFTKQSCGLIKEHSEHSNKNDQRSRKYGI